MITLIQTNQQLFSLLSLLLLVIIVLWILQYAIIGYAGRVFKKALQYWLRFEQYFGLSKRLLLLKISYPKLYNFFWQRLHVQHFQGLPLTLLFLVMGYTLALFVGLVEDVVNADSIVAIDYWVSQQMSLLSGSSVVNFFIPITSLASTPITCLIVFLTALLCWRINQRYLLIGLLIAIIGSTAFTFLSKMLFHRQRPVDILLFERTYSFPSGHATATMAMYGFIAYMAIRFSQSFARQVRILVFTVFFSILVGLSRVLLNEHYLSDVLGGYLVGLLWLTVAISVTEWLTARHNINWQLDWSTAQLYQIRFSVVAVLISTIIYAAIYQFPLLV